jgi:hypothetical protein
MVAVLLLWSRRSGTTGELVFFAAAVLFWSGFSLLLNATSVTSRLGQYRYTILAMADCYLGAALLTAFMPGSSIPLILVTTYVFVVSMLDTGTTGVVAAASGFAALSTSWGGTGTVSLPVTITYATAMLAAVGAGRAWAHVPLLIRRVLSLKVRFGEKEDNIDQSMSELTSLRARLVELNETLKKVSAERDRSQEQVAELEARLAAPAAAFAAAPDSPEGRIHELEKALVEAQATIQQLQKDKTNLMQEMSQLTRELEAMYAPKEQPA